MEGWFSQLERRALYRGVFTSVTDLKAAIRQFITAHNEYSAKPFKWNKTAEAIITSVYIAKLSVMKNKLMNETLGTLVSSCAIAKTSESKGQSSGRVR